MLRTDGNSTQAKLMLGIYRAFAEYERDLLREGTTTGLAAARARDRKGPAQTAGQHEGHRAKQLHARGS